MLYIYKFTNKTTGKTYIGQTNNIVKRKIGHKSESFNPKASGYHLPFHCAIRIYGWDNFDFEIIEEIPDEKGRDYLNEREIYYIEKYKSLVSENGYNLTKGGDGCAKPEKTFKEKCACSKLLTEEEIRDIQDMLYNYYCYEEILEKYPQISDSFLSNINTGLNFKREDLNYPISPYHCFFRREIQDKIIEDLINKIDYPIISKRYGISTGLLSQINSGARWTRRELKYPLSVRVRSEDWVELCIKDAIFTDLTNQELADKYKVSKSTIKALVQGVHHKNNKLIYPLKTNKIQNQKIYKELF